MVKVENMHEKMGVFRRIIGTTPKNQIEIHKLKIQH